MKLSSLLILTLFFVQACTDQTSTVHRLSVGASQASINPKPGAFIAGDRNNRTFVGIHDSLYVKALVVEEDGNTLVILTYDCIGMLYPMLEAIRSAVAQAIPSIDPGAIVMSSTHTHAGPDVVGIWGADPMSSGVDSVYMQYVLSASQRAIQRAWGHRQSAYGIWGETTHGKDWVHNISEPEEVDRSLQVIQFLNTDNKSIATLTNFACHPTFLDARFDQVSADYIGGFYAAMDASLGGTNLFIQGAIGGWVQPEGEVQSFTNAFRRGKGLATSTLKSLANAQRLADEPVRYVSRRIQFPVENARFQAATEIGVIPRKMDDSVQTEIAWFSIGDAQFATHPGETAPAHGLATKSLMKSGGPRFIVGLGNDALGYILKPSYFNPRDSIPHAAYLSSMSLGPETAPIMMNTLRELSRSDLERP